MRMAGRKFWYVLTLGVITGLFIAQLQPVAAVNAANDKGNNGIPGKVAGLDARVTEAEADIKYLLGEIDILLVENAIQDKVLADHENRITALEAGGGGSGGCGLNGVKCGINEYCCQGHCISIKKKCSIACKKVKCARGTYGCCGVCIPDGNICNE